MTTMHEQARAKFEERIRNGMLGPGSDVYGLPDEEEIISDFPLQRYFTGILFPPRDPGKSLGNEADSNSQSTIDSDDDAPDEFDKQNENNISEEESLTNENRKAVAEDDDSASKNYASANQYFPTNMGLTFCVKPEVEKIEVEFSFGIYDELKQSDVRLAVSEDVYQTFMDDPEFPFRDKLSYESGYLFLSKELKGSKRSPRSEDYKSWDEYKKSCDQKKQDSAYLDYFDKLLGRTWKRSKVSKKLSFELKNTNDHPFELFTKTISKGQVLKLSCHLKIYDYNHAKYVKILLSNESTQQSRNQFSIRKELLNKKCFFQTSIRVENPNIIPFKSRQDLNPFDEEARKLNFLYRDVKSYGIGHGCAVNWNAAGTVVETSFLPYYDSASMKNQLDDDYLENDLKIPAERILQIYEGLDVYNLSEFSSLSKEQIIGNLRQLVTTYEKWILTQEEIHQRLDRDSDKEIAEPLLKTLHDNKRRLEDSLKLLENDKVFSCFRKANTAMFIQMVLSNDEDFAKKEKHLSQIPAGIDYNNLEFFKHYKKFRPAYRPFQLAFILLNLKGIVDPVSDERNKIVDLIWFPTGGGKTEAYLAVTAFTIIWRRMNHGENGGGTTVIMRYTLRLLTAQQFERASRLIAALEFLRRDDENDLGKEQINIGLWVGMASTPNTIDDARETISEMTPDNNPENKNNFQISACPWCGCKLFNQNPNGTWIHAFQDRRTGPIVMCLNKNCAFHGEIPLQVIDEMLYKKPPTLLFATVDKFAMLAWREEGHKFFNSHPDDKGLPPDLIIQDELHLLSGPLGSITGIYESIIELLCTKNGRKPKIIASTATTRNTNFQVNQLYGKNRIVNVFPPSGLSYEDSFFAREDSEKSIRRYMGFMPTGKTALDTELHLLAHLLIARLDVYKEFTDDIIDNYWTIVSYYNSLKEIGKIYNKVNDEIRVFTSQHQNRLFHDDPALKFNVNGLLGRTRELTSRIPSEKIKASLKELEEENISKEKFREDAKGWIHLNNVVDLVLATNMISVGLDVDRLNIMLVNGQPRNAAEYIQATSRVARKHPGLVIPLLDANRARDKSHLEHFRPFHQAYYKGVEPLSLTPFTENTIEKMLASMLVTFVRHKLGLNGNQDANRFPEIREQINELKMFIQERMVDHYSNRDHFLSKLDDLIEDWVEKVRIAQEGGNTLAYKVSQYNMNLTPLMEAPSESIDDDMWAIMQSMREIDTSTFIQVKENYTFDKKRSEQ